jgi:hypothetical protein
MRRQPALLAVFRRPRLSLPVGEPRGRLVGHAFPPHVAVFSEGDIGVDDVLAKHLHRVRVRLLRRPGRDAEEARLGIDGAKPPVLSGLDPGDVFADRRDLPPLKRGRGNQHGEVRLAARRRKCGRHVDLLALRRLDAEDEHVLGEPAFVSRHDRCDAQGQAFLAEQRVTPVARAERPDLARLREMDDPFLLLVARPCHVLLAGRDRRADGMDARHEGAILAQPLHDRAAHPGHDPHVHGDVRRVGDLYAHLRDGRTDGAHRERHYVHRASAHATVEQPAEGRAHLRRRHPVVRRAGVVLALAADERAVFHASHVAGVGAREVGAGTLLFIELDEAAGANEPFTQRVVLHLRPVAPHDALRLRQPGRFRDPLAQRPMADPGRSVRLVRRQGRRCIHLRLLQKASGPAHGWAGREFGSGKCYHPGVGQRIILPVLHSDYMPAYKDLDQERKAAATCRYRTGKRSRPADRQRSPLR